MQRHLMQCTQRSLPLTSGGLRLLLPASAQHHVCYWAICFETWECCTPYPTISWLMQQYLVHGGFNMLVALVSSSLLAFLVCLIKKDYRLQNPASSGRGLWRAGNFFSSPSSQREGV